MIRIRPTSGIMPRVQPKLLPEGNAQTALNCKFDSGTVKPFKAALFVATPAKAGTKKSLYLYASQFWFHWLEDVNICEAPVAADAYGRVYWTGEGVPKMTVNDIATAGGTQYPTNSYSLGIPAHPDGMTTTVGGTPTDPDPLSAEARAYCATLVSAYGEEGPPCSATVQVNVQPGETVTVGSFPAAPGGSYNFSHRRIYRRVTGSNGGAWIYLATLAIATASWVDTLVSADLVNNETLPSLEWDPPPADLTGLIPLPSGSLCGFYGKQVCFSVPFQPHAWPAAYRFTMDHTVVAIGAFGTSVLVTTTGLPYVITGGDPANGMSNDRLEKGEACVSKRSMVDMGTFCVYAGATGLWVAGVGKIELVTAPYFTIDEWNAYNPSSMLGCHHDGQYIVFYDTGTVQGGLIFNPATGALSTTDVFATAAWNNPADGKLYLIVNGNIVQWDAGGTVLTGTWKSKPFKTAWPLNHGAAQVFAESYPVTLKVWADGSLKLTKTVADDKPFRLPGGFRATWWETEVSGTSEVTEIALAQSIEELTRV